MGEKGAEAVLEHLAGDQPGIRVSLHLRERVLAAAEADLKLELRRAMREGGERVGCCRGGKAQARQRLVEQETLARAERMPARAAVEAVGRRLEEGWLQRPNALRSAGTRSVRSQVNVPFSGSGVRPKWP